MSYRERETVKGSLVRKGFLLKDGRTDHWRFIYISQTGKKTSINTKISRGTKYKIITDNLLLQMVKQCKLPKTEFLELVDCPLSREQYEERLRGVGLNI